MNNSKTTTSKSRNPSRRRLAWSHHQSTDLRSNPLISTSQSLQSRQQQLKKPTNPSTEHKSITTPPKPQCVRTSPNESVNYGNNPIWDSIQKWTCRAATTVKRAVGTGGRHAGKQWQFGCLFICLLQRFDLWILSFLKIYPLLPFFYFTQSQWPVKES